MSLAAWGSKSDSSTLGTLAATAAAVVGFPVVFYAFALAALSVLAALLAGLGATAASGASLEDGRALVASFGISAAPRLSLQDSSLVWGIGIAVANFLVALIVLSITSSFFAGAKQRLIAIGFAVGYTAAAYAVTISTTIGLDWSVSGVLAAAMVRLLLLASASAHRRAA